MEQRGTHCIPAPRQQVWEALNDPDVLARCIDGCESMTDLGEGRFAATVAARVGPVRSTFQADIHLTDVVVPESYRLEVQVKGGVAGFARGVADVRLEASDSGHTQLAYTVNGAIGGKLAQIGSRLVDSAVRKLTASFFERFVAYVEGAK